MMKKLLALLLALTMVFAFAACTTDEGKYKEIVYLLAKLPDGPVSPADGELTDCWLLSAEEALERISTTREREILQKAAERLGVCR